MREFFLLPIVYVAALLETWLAPRWEVRGITPDLLALAAFAWLAGARGRYAFIAVALVGLVSDLNSHAPLGSGMAALAIVAYSVIFLRRNLHLEGLFAQVLIVGFGTTAACLVQGVALKLLQQNSDSVVRLIERAGLAGLYTAAVSIPITMIIFWMKPKHTAAPVAVPTA
jgi:rod shape-determining protein MreD